MVAFLRRGGVLTLVSLVFCVAVVVACGQQEAEEGGGEGQEAASSGGDSLTLYVGRNAELVGPVIDEFNEEVDIDVQARYGNTAELAATILEEGENSPADIFFVQDASALGALSNEERLAELPEDILEPVDERFVSPDGVWVGTSGRTRVVAYNTDTLTEADLPDSVLDFTEPEWEGRIGWAPTNTSFQAFITAMRVIEGEDVAREWLEGIQANDPAVFENNSSTLEAIVAGEVDIGFINHYYYTRFFEERGGEFGARNYYPTGGDIGALVNVGGAGILTTSDNVQEAEDFLRYLISEEVQEYFAEETYEYPTVQGVEARTDLPSIEEIDTPDIDLSDLDDLQGTIQLLQETGAL